jgi:hypothetical protein
LVVPAWGGFPGARRFRVMPHLGAVQIFSLDHPWGTLGSLARRQEPIFDHSSNHTNINVWFVSGFCHGPSTATAEELTKMNLRYPRYPGLTPAELGLDFRKLIERKDGNHPTIIAIKNKRA